MHSPNLSQGYSDFFTSGLRAMTTGGPNLRRAKAVSVDLYSNRASFWTDEYFDLGRGSDAFSTTRSGSAGRPQRRRHLSVIVGKTAVDDRAVPAPIAATKNRRSGFSSLSARFFSRLSPMRHRHSIPSPSPSHEEDEVRYADDEKEKSSLSTQVPSSLASLHSGR